MNSSVKKNIFRKDKKPTSNLDAKVAKKKKKQKREGFTVDVSSST